MNTKSQIKEITGMNVKSLHNVYSYNSNKINFTPAIVAGITLIVFFVAIAYLF